MFACVSDVHWWNVGALTPWHVRGGQRTTSGVGPDIPSCLRQGLLLLCVPSWQVLRLPGCLCVPSPNRDTEITMSRLYVESGDLKSDPCGCTANTLPLSPLPSPPFTLDTSRPLLTLFRLQSPSLYSYSLHLVRGSVFSDIVSESFLG